MAISLYRKYRPNTFADVVGQEHVEKTLINAVGEGTLSHAYLFCGPRGTGKTTSARLLAKALLCEKGPTPDPDGNCPQCEEISQGIHPDVYELDAASRTGVENVRDEIISRVQFAPTRGRYKVYIIDEVHMLTTAAFNALLKTLEEPPSHVVFILCTTDPHKIPETIQSRCQRFDFRRLSIDEIVGYLQRICAGEGYTAEPEALEFMAAKAAGGMRDATTSLEQVAVFTQGNITLEAAKSQLGQMDSAGLFQIANLIAGRDAAGAFRWIDEMVGKGIDLSQLAHDLAAHIRNLYVAQLTGGEATLMGCPSADLPRYCQQAEAFGGADRLSRAMDICGDLMRELRSSADARLSFEMALVRLCRSECELTLESLAERVESLEAGIPAPKMIAAIPVSADYVAAAAAAPAPAEPVAAPEPESVFEDDCEDEYVYDDDEAEDDEFVPDAVAHSTNSGDMRQARADAYARQREENPVSAPAAPMPAAAAPEPEPVAAAPASNMSPARIMAAVLTEVKRQDMPTGALLSGVTLEYNNGRYELVFPADGTFAMSLIAHGEPHTMIASAFAKVLGAPAEFSCRVIESAQSSAPKTAESFGFVSATEAAAPAAGLEDGYVQAMEAYAADYAAYDDYGYDDAAPVATPEVDTAAFVKQAQAAVAAGPVDEPASDQGSSAPSAINDALSVFGSGIVFEEI